MENLLQALIAFMDAKDAEGCRPRTLDFYRKTLVPHIVDLGIARAPADVTPGEIDRWVACRRREISDASLANQFAISRAFWNWLVDRNVIDVSPVRVRVRRPKISPLHDRSISDADIDAMLAAAQVSGPRDYAIVCFLLETGARAEATATAQIRDLNLETCSAWVTEKGGVRVEMSYTEETAEALRAWLAVRPPVDGDSVFLSAKRHRPLTANTLWQILKGLAKAAGVSRGNPHAFRHSVGRRFIEGGAPLTVVQGKLHHSSVEITAKYYLNQTERAVREATRAFSPLVGRKRRAARVTVTGTVIHLVSSRFSR